MTHSLPARRSADPALFRGVSVVEPGAVFKFAALSIAAAAIFAGQPVFWTLPPRFLTGARAAAGFAAINSVGNLGGLIAQPTVPAIHEDRKSVVEGKSVSVRVDVGGSGFINNQKRNRRRTQESIT